MAEYAHLSNINTEFADALAKLPPAPPVLSEDLAICRENYPTKVIPACHALFEGYMPPESAYKVTDRRIDVDGAQLLARCVVPTPKTGEDGKFPLLFWIHGGGWTIGGVDWDDYKVRKLAVDQRISVVNIDYRLAPENPFPAAPNDCLAALKYVASNEESFSADLSRGFLIGGMSAGGNLTAVTTHQYLDDPLSKSKPLTGQLLVAPIICHPKAYPEAYKSQLLSMEQNKNAPILSRSMMNAFLNWYQGNPSDPRLSPLLFPSHKFKVLPPAFVQVYGMDPLRDDGLLYEKVMRENGVKTKLEIYPGVPHAFELAAPSTKLCRKFVDDFEKGVQWLLHAV
ncbi:hypothetical protein E1B28_002392 [Marasmius oreades]|uniref:Alpha/beta hydrolase fold-3 domain-containing protein n=1 Tax=Marasmius oreades TaxID=181124 RepID=A0A9P7RNH5_9AGAR|nr:uncharacterized protein E1B28_002392 [Marasmius oreades]KAG7086438.1 hypothetical protein E1B28_002392 [Marasmius oreades]